MFWKTNWDPFRSFYHEVTETLKSKTELRVTSMHLDTIPSSVTTTNKKSQTRNNIEKYDFNTDLGKYKEV